MLEKMVRNQNKQLSIFNTTDKPVLYDEEPYGLGKEDGNSKHSALTRQGKAKRSKKA